MKAQEVRIKDAVGLPLAYDLTEIVPGQRKGAVLRRGHLIQEEDLSVLARIGKSWVLVLELEPGEVHEDEAAVRLAGLIAGPGVGVSQPGEAWADVRASGAGLLKVDTARLQQINAVGELLVATRHNSDAVRAGELVAKAKVVGLTVAERRLTEAAKIAAPGPIVQVRPYRSLRAAIIVTGREVYEGRVKDAFGPLLTSRLEEYGSSAAEVRIIPDEAPIIAGTVREALSHGMELVLVTGGMSPDDSTPEGIRQSGAKVEFYGMPVSPGAMTLVAYAGVTPVMGVPAGLLTRGRGIFDVVLPRLLAGERLEAGEVARYGHGGLCWACPTCTYPMCPFGKGI